MTPADLILALVREIPPGRLAAYGQVADCLPGVRPRYVGHVLAGLAGAPDTGRPQAVPWHRVINATGAISAHPAAAEQRRRLEAEGVQFDARGRIDWPRYRWAGPSHVWYLSHGLDPDIAAPGRIGTRSGPSSVVEL